MRYSDLLEASIPPSDYGYWVDPVGRIIPVEFERHLSVLRDQGMDSHKQAFRDGWIRIVVWKNFYANFSIDHLTNRALNAMIKLARTKDFLQYTFGNTDHSTIRNKSFDTFSDFSRFVSEIRQPVLTESHDVPVTTYGYWITPDGKIHPVDWCNHYEIMRLLNPDMETKPQVMDAGWIRVVSANNTLDVEFSAEKISSKARNSLMRVAKSLPYKKYCIEDGHSATWSRTIAEFNRSLNKNLIPVTESVIPMSDYGYWISPEGHIHPVGVFKHSRVLYDKSKILENDIAFKLGWIRIVSLVRLEVEFKKMTNRGRSSLIRLAKAHPYTSYTIVTGNESKRTTTILEFVRSIDEMANTIPDLQLVEASLPPTTYGYWIDPKGKIYPVGFQSHESDIQKIARITKKAAIAAGWIRVVAEENHGSKAFDVEAIFDRVSGPAKSAMMRLARNDNYVAFSVEIAEDTYTVLPRYDFRRCDNFGEFARIVAQLSERELVESTIPVSTYGYWVDSFGEIYSVGFQDHERVIGHVSKMTQEQAIASGWARIISLPQSKTKSFEVEAMMSQLSYSTKSAITKLARLDNFETYSIDVFSPTGEAEWYRYTNLSDFNRRIGELTDPEY